MSNKNKGGKNQGEQKPAQAPPAVEQPKQAAPQVSEEKAKEIVKKLQGVLRAHPHVKTIYVNEKGDYHFAPIPGFHALKHSDVMEVEFTESPSTDEQDQGQGQQTPTGNEGGNTPAATGIEGGDQGQQPGEGAANNGVEEIKF